MISDETAYRRYLDGEEKAADLLVEKYGDPLTLYINGYLKDIHEAEDLMIEAFSQIFAKERPITGAGAFKAYLYKTARNLALRHRKKHRLSFLRFEELDFEPQSDVSADAELSRSERSRQLYDALGKLKEEYREALYLVYFEDMSYRNAATVMNKSEGQITKLVYRGKQSLKATLEQEGFTYADE
ncbi:MAG: sigma-70 family RNA polymerase sigma factor [Dysosmobacter sp.]|nr:sigma-70 family RNA polymerase sigma factor [Dysosmobacter sp.]